MDPRIPYIAPFFIAAAGIFFVALRAWPRRKARGGWILFFTCLASAHYAFTEGLLYFGSDVETNMWITRMQYFGITPLPPLILLFVLNVFGFESYIKKWFIVGLFSIAALNVILVWTNPLHRLYYSACYTIDSGLFPMLGLEHGPLYWLSISYDYLLLLFISLVLVRQMVSTSSYHQGQAGVILVSVLVFWILNAVYIAGLSPVPNMDIGPLAFAFVAASFAWGFFRYSLLDIMPVAKAEIFNSLADPIVVLDDRDRVVDMNPAASELFHVAASDVLGKDIGHVIGRHFQLPDRLLKAEPSEVCLEDGAITCEMTVSPLEDRRQRPIGRLVVLRDITERKRMEEELRRLAVTDPLTGALNRRRLIEQAEAEFARAKRRGRGLAALMIDIDHFKRVNDSHGHAAGDAVLKALVGACMLELRNGDLFGRMGGEEFLAVLTEPDGTGPYIVAERLRRRIEAMEVEHESERLGITVSLGVAVYGNEDGRFPDMLRRADRALYRAKAEGRNCVRPLPEEMGG